MSQEVYTHLFQRLRTLVESYGSELVIESGEVLLSMLSKVLEIDALAKNRCILTGLLAAQCSLDPCRAAAMGVASSKVSNRGTTSRSRALGVGTEWKLIRNAKPVAMANQDVMKGIR